MKFNSFTRISNEERAALIVATSRVYAGSLIASNSTSPDIRESEASKAVDAYLAKLSDIGA